MTNEDSILDRVRALVEEEHQLRSAFEDGDVSASEEQARVRQIEEELDQCWDLLRQRRARAAAGQDPEDSGVRPVSTVENYRQ
jgi:hypothetical protein